MKARAIGFSILLAAAAALAQPGEVIQNSLNANNPALFFGSPFGQSFQPTSGQSLVGVALATVDDVGAADLFISLYTASSDGSTILGGPITSGMITAAQISSFYSPTAGPTWFPIYFDQPYAQTPGEHLAFVITGGGSLNYHYTSFSSYAGGRVLGNASIDLTFGTLVPEPGTAALFLAGALACFRRSRARRL